MRERIAYTKTPIAISAERIRSFNTNLELGSKKVSLKKYTAIPITPDTKNSLITDDNIFLAHDGTSLIIKRRSG